MIEAYNLLDEKGLTDDDILGEREALRGAWRPDNLAMSIPERAHYLKQCSRWNNKEQWLIETKRNIRDLLEVNEDLKRIMNSN